MFCSTFSKSESIEPHRALPTRKENRLKKISLQTQLLKYIHMQRERDKIKKTNSNIKPVLLGEKLVFIDLATTAFVGIAGPFFPFVWYYHLR